MWRRDARHVDGDVESFLEPRPLDVEIGLHQFELPAEGRELAVGSQDGAQERREPHERLQGAVGGAAWISTRSSSAR